MSATKVIREACKCGCCITKVNVFNNTTTVADGAVGDFDCTGDLVPPYTHSDTDRRDCGSTPCPGAWAQSTFRMPQTFAQTGSGTGIINDCIFGEKMVVSKKAVMGRRGYLDDYLANPKITDFFTGYTVTVQLSESFNGSTKQTNDGSSPIAFISTANNGQTSGQAQSIRTLTVGGIENCVGSATSDGGQNTRTDAGSAGYASGCYTNVSKDNDFRFDFLSIPGGFTPTTQCMTGMSPEILLKYYNDYSYSTAFNSDGGAAIAAAKAFNKGYLETLCAINCDRGNVVMPVPLTAGYTGPYGGFAAWLLSQNRDTGVVTDVNGNTSRSFATFTGSLVVTNGSISGQISCEVGVSSTTDVDGITTVFVSDYKYTFSFSAALTGHVAYSSFVEAAIGLLNQWDMSDKVVYPWQNTFDCRVAPMVSLWEIGSQPGWGYCDTAANPTLTAIYDGSVKGAPLSSMGFSKGIYDKGFFEFTAETMSFTSPGGNCNVQICGHFGIYVSDHCGISMATQLVDGFADTGECNVPVPFSRYFTGSWIAAIPPWAEMSCAFLSGDSGTVYASKWAEKKVPLKSQNFFGTCGATMKAATLIDANCNPTMTLRYPTAATTCDTVWSTGAPRGDFIRLTNSNGTVTASQENVVPITSRASQTDGIISILPTGSPELLNPKWVGLHNATFTDGYPMIAPTEFWYQVPQQAMHDRFFTTSQDKMTNDGSGPPGACTAIIPAPETPYVEARIIAPSSAPFDFSSGDDNAYSKLPSAPWSDFSWTCLPIWNLTDQFTTLAYTTWPGVSAKPESATADQYSTGGTGDATNAGFGTE